MRSLCVRLSLLGLCILLLWLSGCSGEPSGAPTQPGAQGGGPATGDAGSQGQDATSSTESEPRKGGTLRIGWQYDPPNLDIHLSTHTQINWPALHVYETLFTFNSDYEPVPHLVDTYEVSSDSLTYTFELRKGVTFHNGKEMTSEDVVASFERWIQVTSHGRETADLIAAVRATGPYTVEIQLKQPTGLFLFSLAQKNIFPAIMPAEVVRNAGADPVTEYIGTGPYQVAEFSPGRQIRLVRYEDYVSRDEEPSFMAGRRNAYVDEIVFIPAPDETARSVAIESGDFDIATWINPVDFERLQQRNDILVAKESPFMVGFKFNMKEGIFAGNRKLRQAVLTAIDPEAVMLGAVGNPELFMVTPSPINHQTAFFTEEGAREAGWGAADPERAR